MKRSYEVYGIPDDLFLDISNIYKYDYVVFYPTDNNFIFLDGIGSAELDNKDYVLWGAVEYWTELEASLLIAGLNPHNQNLYAVGEMCTRDNEGLPIKTNFFWVNEHLLLVAKEHSFLFQRSLLTPKAPPIEWIRYYKQNFYTKSVKEETFVDFGGYSKKWFNYFSLELSKNNQTEKVLKQESTRKTENLLRALTAIAIDAYAYNPKDAKSNAPQDIVDAMSQHGAVITSRTIRDWLKEGASLLEIKLDKD